MRPRAHSPDQHRPSDRTRATASPRGTGNRRRASLGAPSPPGRLWKPSGDKQRARAALAICCFVPGFKGRLLNLLHTSGLSNVAQPFPATWTERPKFRCCFYCVPTPPPPRSKGALGCRDEPAGALRLHPSAGMLLRPAAGRARRGMLAGVPAPRRGRRAAPALPPERSLCPETPRFLPPAELH